MEKKTVVRPRKRDHHVQHFLAADGVEGAGGLVQKEEPRRVDERLRQAQPLPHAAGVAADAVVDVGQVGQFQQALHPLLQHGAGEPEELAGELKEAAGVHPGVEAGHVRQEPEQRPDLVAGGADVLAKDPRRSGRGMRQPGQDAERRGLAQHRWGRENRTRSPAAR